jgi:integrase
MADETKVHVVKYPDRANLVMRYVTRPYATAHDLRRTFGTRCAKRLMPAVVKDLMRHSSVSTTMSY